MKHFGLVLRRCRVGYRGSEIVSVNRKKIYLLQILISGLFRLTDVLDWFLGWSSKEWSPQPTKKIMGLSTKPSYNSLGSLSFSIRF
jgi:hypothetical protein